MTDRLVEIKKRRSGLNPHMGNCLTLAECDYLIAEVERLRGRVDALRRKTGWIATDGLQTIPEMVREIARLQAQITDMQSQHARDLKTALTQHKPECG